MGKIWQYLKETVSDFSDDYALSRAAAIAYYTVLSLGPVLVICIAIAGLAFGQEAAQGAMVGQLRGLMGDQAAEAIQTMIASAGKHRSGIWATIIGFVTLLITASGVFSEMQSALNYIWKAQAKGGVSAILRARAASLGLVATMGFLLLVSLVVSAGLSALGDFLNTIMPGIKVILQIVNILISFVIVTALFAAV
ncbi:MAG: YihY/virulence factor BrkB family protein, partial [Acetobacteraceae bacterium]|nr:YihY/virulence factor BrkB family protein [Acetobacteraceae bacterium]